MRDTLDADGLRILAGNWRSLKSAAPLHRDIFMQGICDLLLSQASVVARLDELLARTPIPPTPGGDR